MVHELKLQVKCNMETIIIEFLTGKSKWTLNEINNSGENVVMIFNVENFFDVFREN